MPTSSACRRCASCIGGEAQFFARWPELPQAEFLAPQGYEAVYRTNATTRHGEHGNAMLSRWPVLDHQHEDMSDHRFEQRGLLHSEIELHGRPVHVVVVHLGLIRASRVRQLAQLQRFIDARGSAQTRRWSWPVTSTTGARPCSAKWRPSACLAFAGQPQPTFPSRLPLAQLDQVFVRGMRAAEPAGAARTHLVAHVGPSAAGGRVRPAGLMRTSSSNADGHRAGHQITLLQGGGEYFPALEQALDAARHEVRLETYIFSFDAAGQAIAEALIRAAGRGVKVFLTVDGVGTPRTAAVVVAALRRQRRRVACVPATGAMGRGHAQPLASAASQGLCRRR